MIPDSKLSRGYLHPFWNGGSGRFLYGVGELPRTLIELAMCQLSATIRRSEAWWEKLTYWPCRVKWEQYGLSNSYTIRTSSGNTAVELTRGQVRYVLDELDSYEALRDSNCQVSCFERIWETTSAVDSEFLLSLQQNILPLRSECEETSTAMLLVSPCSHPLIYGRTLSFDANHELVPTPSPMFSEQNYTLSPTYAWVPTPFLVSQDIPHTTTALSYINGIYPGKTDLYRCIEKLLAHSIPLLEHVLTDLHRSNLLWHRIPGTCKYTTWDEPLTPQHSDDEEGWLNYQREIKQWTLERPLKYPDIPKDGYPGGLERKKFKATLSGRTIEVVVKVAEVILTPNEPKFFGTPWHVEGMRNERIVASVVHCVALSNISPTSLSFRMPVQAPAGYAHDDEGATIRTWGLKLGSPSHQYLGSASLRLGHAIGFPNVYQYQFTDVHLEDPTRPGSLTLVTFALVDPEIAEEGDNEVLSTANVPPQQAGWVRQALEESLDVRIPTEVIDRIMAHTEGLILDEEAREIAEQVKLERIRFWKQHNEMWFSLPFNGLDG